MKSTFLSFILIATFGLASLAQELNVGDKAPKFKTLADDGSTWNLNDHLGKKFIVVYFYPAAMTGGCTKQACTYRDFKNEIADVNAVVVGVSGDNVEGLQLFKKANDLNFPLLSDESGEVATKFGVPMRDGGSISREFEGQTYDLIRANTPARWTFVIDKKGKIAYKNTSVDVTNETKEILDFIKNNS